MGLDFLLTALVVVIAPGTGVIYTLSVSLGRGLTAGLAAVVGCSFGIVPHLAAALLGLAAILHASAVAFQIVKYAGVIFLLWMAWKTLKDTGTMGEGLEAPRGLARIAVRGALINVLNPKLSIFFLAFLPQFVDPAGANATGQMMLLGLVFTAMTAAVFAIYAVFAAAARRRLLGNATAMRWLRRTFAAAFGGLALRLASETR